MPNVVRGGRMSGLMVYLAGPGKANEHDEPHLVAGDDALMAWYRDVELDRGSALAIARHLDKPRKVFGTDVTVGVYERQQTGRDEAGRAVYKSVRTGSKDAHVWHCSLSLRAEEGQISDEKWGQISDEFVRTMGFDDHEGTKAPCRWVAVRHGTSTEGNDHIHLAVSLVREDGTKATTHKDFYRAQQAARALEVAHGLERLESSVNLDVAPSRGFTPGEQAKAEKTAQRTARERMERAYGTGSWDALDGAGRQARVAAEWRINLPCTTLARSVRGYAAASGDEGEFVRRMRRGGLLVRPRFAEGAHDVITGYSVAARPTSRAERPVWYGGGRLGRDLTLPRLRAEWPDDPEKATDAAAEWNAAYRGRRVITPGRETAEYVPQLWQEHAAALRKIRTDLGAVPIGDRDTWPRIARQAAGVLSAWSTRVEAAPGNLASAADALARSAQTTRPQQPTPQQTRMRFAGAALMVSAATRLGRGPVGQAAMIHEVMGLCRALAEVADQTHQTRQAASLRRAAEGNLERVHRQLAAWENRTLTPAQSTSQRDGAVAVVEPPAVDTVDPELRRIANIARMGTVDAREAVRKPLPNELARARQHEVSQSKDHDQTMDR